ncbi:uncharacterized protein LOC133832508 [Humulus lupulus]|uniref:uncharacterized protein LOC133832508 n=1 Tax=Humulus lupulus TaxID=3486 RepID=UPI002B40EB56|nr:uncharacterized protein LOC133832508 [Humulus lupulus]
MQSSSLENMLKEYIVKNEAMIQSQVGSLRNLENQVGQLANELRNIPHGTLPSDTENPRNVGKEHCKAVTLRSGEELENIPIQILALSPRQLNFKATTSISSTFLEAKVGFLIQETLDMLKQLHINIPLVEALEQMPNYVKFMKDVLTRKRRLGEFETMALTKECSSFLQDKFPPKLKDPGSFIIPCTIGNTYCGMALCDLGAIINLMSMSVFKKLGIGEFRPTTITLQLANRSLAHPDGKIEDVFVRVDKFIFPADLIMLDYELDTKVPIILGRPFLET